MHIKQMMASHPRVQQDHGGEPPMWLVRCATDAWACAQTCLACADACLAEPDPARLARCIRLDHDCAAVCLATGEVLTRRSGALDSLARPLVQACIAACRLCAEECDRHAAHHDHCRICAESCRHCAALCSEALAADEAGATVAEATPAG